MLRIKCEVTLLEPYTETVFNVKLKPEQKVAFQAGQYLMVVMAEDDKRPFSIASNPTKNDVLELHIGASEQNSYAMQVVERLKSGFVEVELPAGNAGLREGSERPLVLIAGGTGFSYTKSILERAIEVSQRPISLYWGAREESHLYALELAQSIAASYPQVTFIPVVESAPTLWSGKVGQVHKVVMDDIANLADCDIYIAGRFEMAAAARSDFAALGVTGHLYGDAFEFI
jgi:aquacobalamin reductase/NAD(P)H-flavin reductase